MGGCPVRVEPQFFEKVWGTTELEPWFPDSKNRIGEVWFPAGEILVKFLFTSARLSVQVHPDDAFARRVERQSGKTELWYLLRTETGARIAMGFRRSISPERIREAALSGEIETLIDWVPVSKGETYLSPSGTVHAIGAGIVLCEIQQNSDITYRLYDYGRPRELHLDKAMQVVHGEPHSGRLTPVPQDDGSQRLAGCQHFVTDLLEIEREFTSQPQRGKDHALVVLEGTGKISGQAFQPGQVWRLPDSMGPCRVEPNGKARLLRCFVPVSQ